MEVVEGFVGFMSLEAGTIGSLGLGFAPGNMGNWSRDGLCELVGFGFLYP